MVPKTRSEVEDEALKDAEQAGVKMRGKRRKNTSKSSWKGNEVAAWPYSETSLVAQLRPVNRQEAAQNNGFQTQVL